MTFHLTDKQLDDLAETFRGQALAVLDEPLTPAARAACDAWHAAANLLHQSRMAAAQGRSAAARARRLRLQSRDFAATL